MLPRLQGRYVCNIVKKHGYCPRGATCGFDHPSEYVVKQNLHGYPIRPGEPVRFVTFSQVLVVCLVRHIYILCSCPMRYDQLAQCLNAVPSSSR